MSIFCRGRGIVESRQPTRNIQSKNWHPFEKEQDRVTYIFGSEDVLIAREGGGLQSLELMAIAVAAYVWLRWPRAMQIIWYSYDGCTIDIVR